MKFILFTVKRKQEDNSPNKLEFNPRIFCRLTWLKTVNILCSVKPQTALINLIQLVMFLSNISNYWTLWNIFAFSSVQLNKHFPAIPFFLMLWELIISKYTKSAKKEDSWRTAFPLDERTLSLMGSSQEIEGGTQFITWQIKGIKVSWIPCCEQMPKGSVLPIWLEEALCSFMKLV